MNGQRHASVIPDSLPGDEAFLAGAGEMGTPVRSVDWRKTPLGPLAQWPQSLRTSMSICLNSRVPIAIYWGPEFLMLYNQSLVPMVGPTKHPQALGQPAKMVLAEKTRPIQVAMTAQPEAISLSVHNFGPAIDPAFLPLIFSPFARGEKPLGSSEGLGLGLNISERIVHAHGGTLTVQSSAQAGTQFTMQLPTQSH